PTCGRSVSGAQATDGWPFSSTSPLSMPPLRPPSPPARTAPAMAARSGSGMLRHAAAKTFVVDTAGDRPVGRAIGAVGVDAQRELAHAAAACVDQHQLTLQGVAEAEYQLEHFQRLKHADQPRHDAKHAGLAARWRLIRRRR